MKKLGLYILMFICIMYTAAAFADIVQPQQLKIQYDNNYRPGGTTTVLKGGISQVQELPVGMYGMWQVKGTLLETNNYDKFAQNSSDIWVLRKDGEFVTLINPQNGANATITVTEVIDNTATFTRGIKSGNMREAETVTMTLSGDGNSFSGTDVIMSQTIFNGVILSDVARYRINGVKISGQTIFRPRSATTVGK